MVRFDQYLTDLSAHDTIMVGCYRLMFLFQYKDKISEAELKEVSSKQGQAAVQKLDRLFDKAEVG